jgi:hypothetical protein
MLAALLLAATTLRAPGENVYEGDVAFAVEALGKQCKAPDSKKIDWKKVAAEFGLAKRRRPTRTTSSTSRACSRGSGRPLRFTARAKRRT